MGHGSSGADPWKTIKDQNRCRRSRESVSITDINQGTSRTSPAIALANYTHRDWFDACVKIRAPRKAFREATEREGVKMK